MLGASVVGALVLGASVVDALVLGASEVGGMADVLGA